MIKGWRFEECETESVDLCEHSERKKSVLISCTDAGTCLLFGHFECDVTISPTMPLVPCGFQSILIVSETWTNSPVIVTDIILIRVVTAVNTDRSTNAFSFVYSSDRGYLHDCSISKQKYTDIKTILSVHLHILLQRNDSPT